MIALVDYGAGNSASVANALNELGKEFKVTKDEGVIIRSEKIIFPGVGEASYAVKQLHMLNLFTVLRICKKPILGICLGMQLLADKSDEGDVTCLGVIPGTVKRFSGEGVKVPHMGWNSIKVEKESRLLKGIETGERFYFANSYYLPVNEYTTSSAEHGVSFSASVEKGHFYGVQFHPEKSGDAGLKILRNFLEL